MKHFSKVLQQFLRTPTEIFLTGSGPQPISLDSHFFYQQSTDIIFRQTPINSTVVVVVVVVVLLQYYFHINSSLQCSPWSQDGSNNFFSFFFFLFFFSIPFIIFALLFSLPPSRNSDPGSHSRLFSTPTRYGSCLGFFIARRFQLFLPSSTRVVTCM